MAQMPKEISLDVLINDNTFIARPGDTLVICVDYPEPLTEEKADYIKERYEAACPGINVAVVQARALVVFRP